MRRIRLAGLLLLDILTLAGALFLALWMRFDGNVPVRYIERASDVLPLFVAGGLLIFAAAGLYSGLWRYASVQDAVRIGAASVAAGLWLALALFVLQPNADGFPRSVILITPMLVTIGAGATRLSARLVRSWIAEAKHGEAAKSRRTLIVGAGDAGVLLLRELLKHGIRPVGFIDDDPAKHRQKIQGVPVLGPRAALREVIGKYAVNDVIVAMPSAPRSVTREVYEVVREVPGVAVRTVPMLYDIAAGKVSIGRPRPIDVTDLLGREPVKINMAEVAAYLRGRRVMVTGAGGSIGTELCRQIASYAPELLILLDHDENGIFDIQHEISSRFPGVPLKAVIADIRDRIKMKKVFDEERPAVVFHAAAHKHVPYMENNPEEAVKTNVFGTQNVAQMALEYNAERFVLISTDKAVNPTSVMGVTKRVAELIVQDLNRAGKTRFMSVRFGNVLGSRGSVVPLFEKQIAQGGPVTVTDPQMTRFFMTIPEAVQLVMQAGALGNGGEVFVLDMGEPVKIMDLASTLIRLHGLEPGKDIEIVITGRRPGEKLYEEVLTAEEGTEATKYDRIFSARVHPPDPERLRRLLQELEQVTFAGHSPLIVDKLVELVPTFEPEAARQTRQMQKTPAFSEVAVSAQNG